MFAEVLVRTARMSGSLDWWVVVMMGESRKGKGKFGGRKYRYKARKVCLTKEVSSSEGKI